MFLFLLIGTVVGVYGGPARTRQNYQPFLPSYFQQQPGQYQQFQGQFPQFQSQNQLPQYQGQNPQLPQFPPSQSQLPQFPPTQSQFPQFPPSQGTVSQFQEQLTQFPSNQGGQQLPQYPGQEQFQSFVPQHDQLKSDGSSVAENSTTPIPIIKLEIQPNNGDGKYEYSYETGNGIIAEERGIQQASSLPQPAEGEEAEPGSDPGPGTAAQGSYSYKDLDGNEYTVTYTADENGYVAQGKHLPTPHPIPQEILEALEQNAAEEAQQNEHSTASPVYQVFLRNAYRNRHQ